MASVKDHTCQPGARRTESYHRAAILERHLDINSSDHMNPPPDHWHQLGPTGLQSPAAGQGYLSADIAMDGM
jgi:hypothetical protein